MIIVLFGIGYVYVEKNSKTEDGAQCCLTDLTASSTDSSVATSTKTPVKTGTVSTGVNTSTFNSYSNIEYNFAMKYPKYVQVRNGFSTFHEIGNNWRLYPAQNNQGKSVVSFSIHNIDQGSISNGHQSYPLYFSAEVRVGVSPNVKECYTTDAGYANQKVTNVTINGVAFKKFSTQSAGMMKYVQAESYRTIHNNMCFALEQIKTGSVYRDDLMATGVAETTLTNYYNEGETIIKTFKFTK